MEKQSFITELKNNSNELPNQPFQTIASSSLLQIADHFNLSPHKAQIMALEAKILPKRYLLNIPSLSIEKQTLLARTRVFLIGLGGLGGYILEILSRSGIGSFILADGDHFEESNLNRQILGTTENIGQSKALEAAKRIKSINPFCSARTIPEFLD
ncbi:MAG: ThiF family adenylyltransferase, partial [Desulfonatronovibrio sp.]